MWETIKKNWKVIVGAIVALFAYIWGRLSNKPRQGTDSIGNSVELTNTTVESTGESLSKLGESIPDVKQSISDIGQSISDIGKQQQSVSETTEDIGNTISRIRKLVDDERERSKLTKNA